MIAGEPNIIFKDYVHNPQEAGVPAHVYVAHYPGYDDYDSTDCVSGLLCCFATCTLSILCMPICCIPLFCGT